MQEQNLRIYMFDNLKAVLILLVVFGHALEPILYEKIKIIYSFIYLFHMPLFVFCSGYLSKYNVKKILTNIFYPFILFQLLYCLFDINAPIQFTTPYWNLWYLFAIAIWILILPLLEIIIKTKIRIIALISFAFLLGILSGFDITLGYYMSLSRIIYFLPFFIVGFCVKRAVKIEKLQLVISKWYIRYIVGILTAVIILWLCFYYKNMDVRWLYGSYAYNGGYSYMTRILFYFSAFVISLFLISVIPKNKTFFSYIGQRSMQIYLLHGFVIYINENICRHIQNNYVKLLISCVLSILVVFILSCRLVQKITYPLFSCAWVYKFRTLLHKQDEKNDCKRFT